MVRAVGYAMKERAPGSVLDRYVLGERSLAGWHEFLTTDPATGEPTGHLETPMSRYGRDAATTAWWATAAQVTYSHATCEDQTTAESINYFMGLAVNDDRTLYELVETFREAVPAELTEQLDWERAAI